MERTDPLMQFFAWEYMSENMQHTGKYFKSLAEHVCSSLPDNSERAVCLRKLLEARECAMRSLVMK